MEYLRKLITSSSSSSDNNNNNNCILQYNTAIAILILYGSFNFLIFKY